VCVPECPVNAIVADSDLEPAQQVFWTNLNAELAGQWPNITRKKDPLPDAEKWKDQPNKLSQLKR
jgi:ferredoxin